jgi:hypothetical protein
MWHANARPAGDTGQSKSSRRGAAAGSPAAARRGTAGPRYGDLPAVPFAQRLQHRLHGGAFRAQVTTDHPRPAERGADLHAQLRAGGQQPHLGHRRPGILTGQLRLRHQPRRRRPVPVIIMGIGGIEPAQKPGPRGGQLGLQVGGVRRVQDRLRCRRSDVDLATWKRVESDAAAFNGSTWVWLTSAAASPATRLAARATQSPRRRSATRR